MAEHSGSEFGSCQGAIVSELSLQMFLGFCVTLSNSSDHSITFPDYVILLDHISHLTPSGLELESLASGPPK